MLMYQHLVQRLKKRNNFMMLRKEQWLRVTQDVRSLQEILKQKKTTKKKNKKQTNKQTTTTTNKQKANKQTSKKGTKTKVEGFISMGAFRIGERNERGDHLVEFADGHKLIIANTLFQRPRIRYWAWESDRCCLV